MCVGIPGAKETVLVGNLFRGGVAGERTPGTLDHVRSDVLGVVVADTEVEEDSREDLLEVVGVVDNSIFRRIVGLVARAVPDLGRSRAVASARHACCREGVTQWGQDEARIGHSVGHIAQRSWL